MSSIWISIYLGVQGRLDRVAKFSAFYLVGFVKEFVIFQWNVGDRRDYVRMPFPIW